MRGIRIVRVRHSDGTVRVGVVDGEQIRLVSGSDPVEILLAGDLSTRVARSIETVGLIDTETLALAPPFELLSPVDAPEAWCAGVTYERSRDARVEESEAAKDVYSRVYDAPRPEIFLKDAMSRRTVGPGADCGVRAESTWTVPEPELALVLGSDGRILALTIADDVTARDIEASNPLYLPQAKLFTDSLVLGPCLLVADPDEPRAITVEITGADGPPIWSAETSTGRMKRSAADLVHWLGLGNPIADGTVLCTGTGVVPPDEVALSPGMRVAITVEGIGRLEHGVKVA